MTASRDGSGLGVRGWQDRQATEDHTQLSAWYAEQDAERTPIPRCECFITDGRGKLEYTGHCDIHPDSS